MIQRRRCRSHRLLGHRPGAAGKLVWLKKKHRKNTKIPKKHMKSKRVVICCDLFWKHD